MVTTDEERRLIAQVADRLARRYATVPVETVVAVVSDTHARFDGRRIRDFVPLLVERAAKEKLSGLAPA